MKANKLETSLFVAWILSVLYTVNQQILAAIKFGISLSIQCTIDVTYVCWRCQILAKIRNSPNSPNIIARQNLLIYSTYSGATNYLFCLFYCQCWACVHKCSKHQSYHNGNKYGGSEIWWVKNPLLLHCQSTVDILSDNYTNYTSNK